jgi:metal-responsive CopG/Arc/MetJ family transcriptional regulator
MPSVTVDIEQKLLNKVSEIAVSRNTTVSDLVRAYLRQLAAREDMSMETRIEKLRAAFDESDAEVGPVTWTREDLHAR